ncbi:MAG: Fic family protein [Candidatus Moraniibacteriota bacterium]|nr:MAG: Fic family protein [Candidatus Moranbacteria bacterium]
MRHLGETSYKQTAFGILPRSKLIPLEVEGIKRAWDFVVKKSEEGADMLTLQFLQEAHREGFGWIFPDMGGKFRTIDVSVSHHTPPKFYLVPGLMDDFLKDVHVRMESLLKVENDTFIDELVTLLAWAHHRFLWIHPFLDYNGRIGRLLNNIILLSLDFPPIELKVETKSGRKAYVEALQAADSGNLSALEEMVKAAFTEAAEKMKELPE